MVFFKMAQNLTDGYAAPMPHNRLRALLIHVHGQIAFRFATADHRPLEQANSNHHVKGCKSMLHENEWVAIGGSLGCLPDWLASASAARGLAPLPPTFDERCYF